MFVREGDGQEAGPTQLAQRIWNSYRVFNNNSHHFCILLVIQLRSRQELTLRILTGEILRDSKTEVQVGTPAGNPMPKEKEKTEPGKRPG